MNSDDDVELIRGSGNIYRDLGDEDADVKQAKAILAAKIISILDENELSTRKAQTLSGVNQSEFVRIRNADFGRFTIDRLVKIVNALGYSVDLDWEISVKPRELEPAG